MRSSALKERKEAEVSAERVEDEERQEGRGEEKDALAIQLDLTPRDLPVARSKLVLLRRHLEPVHSSDLSRSSPNQPMSALVLFSA